MKTLTKTLLCACGLIFVPLALSTAIDQASAPKVYQLPEYTIKVEDPLALTVANEKSTKPEYQLPTYTIEDIAALPEPTHNPIPAISARYTGLNLKLKFTVSEKGRPEGVRLEKPLSSYSDIHKMSFASQMRDQVSNWKFEPAQDANGQPVAVKVRMPVIVAKKAGSLTAIAKLILDDGSDDRS